MKSGVIAAALLLAGCDPAWAQGYPPVPKPVQRAAGHVTNQPADLRDWLDQGVIRAVALPDDEKPGWIVDAAKAPSPLHCGTGGCPLQVWSSRADGSYVKLLDEQVLDWSMTSPINTGSIILTIELHGTRCGLTGSDSCSQVYVWRKGARLVRLQRPRG